MEIGEVIEVIEAFAPPSVQESWDNSGLIVGNRDGSISKVLLALDCTLETVLEAEDIGAELIITHHPLIFKGLKRIDGRTNIGRAIIRAIKSNIAIYSVHTNIDKVLNGVSGLMAKKLNVRNVEILSRDKGETEIGLGVVGDLERPLDFDELCVMVEKQFSPEVLKISKPLEGKISRVALCGGNGSSLIEEAMQSGAQVYISGDISYHNFFCEDGFMVIDIGHYESEIGVLELLSDILSKKLPNFAAHISEGINPVYYIF